MALLDLSKVAVAKARANGIDAAEFDLAEPLPFPDNRFDYACALDTLEHLYNPSAILREMGRVARTVIITVPNFHYVKGRIHMLVGKVPFQSKPRRGHVHWFNLPILQQVANAAGMRIDELHCEGFVRMGAIGARLAKWRPNLFAISFGAVMTRISDKVVLSSTD